MIKLKGLIKEDITTLNEAKSLGELSCYNKISTTVKQLKLPKNEEDWLIDDMFENVTMATGGWQRGYPSDKLNNYITKVIQKYKRK